MGLEWHTSNLSLNFSVLCGKGCCTSALTSGCDFWLQMSSTKIRPLPVHSPLDTILSAGNPVPSFRNHLLCLDLHPPPTRGVRPGLVESPFCIPSVDISPQVLLPQMALKSSLVVLMPKATVPWIPSYVLENCYSWNMNMIEVTCSVS